jgi:arginine exporter protein ArgO
MILAWFAIGFAVIAALTWLGDRYVLKPRGDVVMVDGRQVIVRRKRDNILLMAAIMAMFIALVVGGALIEQEAWLLPPAALFGAFMVWALWMASRAKEATFTEEDVKQAQAMTREARPVIALLVLTVVAPFALQVTDSWLDGWVSFTLFIANLGITAAFFYFSWRLTRRWILKRAGSARI